MKKGLYQLINRLWILQCLSDHQKYIKACSMVKQTQEKLLLDRIETCKDTKYGQQYQFADIKTVQDYQKLVPITQYEDYTTYIEAIEAGESKVLTSDPVLLLELSSGSTMASKHIPYTQTFKEEFMKGINPWAYDLYTHSKQLFSGPAYWSITPLAGEKQRTPGGIPIGFEEDSQYFGRLSKWLLDKLFVAPSELKWITNIDTFHYVTQLFLLKERDLAFISIWNPTFLMILLESLQENQANLIQDLQKGTITPPLPLPGGLSTTLIRKLGKHPERAMELKKLLNADVLADPKGFSLYERLWPNLSTISCWTDANAKHMAMQLQKMFPNTVIQGKGLLATEAFISLPFWGEVGARLAVNAHFFEFEALDGDLNPTGHIHLAHELQIDHTYSVIVTTGGGFYRYKMNDMIQVVGFSQECPRIVFLGKGEKYADLYGEKLNEVHVQKCVDTALKQQGLKPAFYMIAPEQQSTSGYYVLFMEFSPTEKVSHEQLIELGEAVEDALLQNFHYAYCRQLRQLSKLRVFIIESTSPAYSTYIASCIKNGQREGNIKPCALHPQTGWVNNFQGRMLSDVI